jgi:hypothetical protein
LEWIVIDKLIGLPHVRKKQIWHYDDHRLQIAAQTHLAIMLHLLKCLRSIQFIMGQKKRKGVCLSF